MQQLDAPNITVIEVNQNQTSSDPLVQEEDNEDKGIQSDEIIQQVAEEEEQNV